MKQKVIAFLITICLLGGISQGAFGAGPWDSVFQSLEGFSGQDNATQDGFPDSVWESGIAEPPEGAEESESWTILVYLCGTDLESSGRFSGALASADLKEMCRATAGGKVRFVVQTGGARKWYTKEIDSDKNQRFLIRNGKIAPVYEGRRTGMGKSDTLADFLKWSAASYPAEKTGLVFWNHGGGSIAGVCFDELDDYDSLSLLDLEAALLSASGMRNNPFAFIGFDACLMATIETANVLAPYADYMIASEEIIPGSGWDYEIIGSVLSHNPETNGRDLGKAICDAYLKACRGEGNQDEATLSLIDLGAVGKLKEEFDRFSERLWRSIDGSDPPAGMLRSIASAENFGGNNKADGYTNMIDLGGMIDACSMWVDGGSALAALDAAVIYQVRGAVHKDASGLAIYYPLQIDGSKELATFAGVCVSPNYLSFVDALGHKGTDGLFESSYSESGGHEGSIWSWVHSFVLNEETGNYEPEEEEDTYWEYIDDLEVTGESPRITFAKPPQFDEDGCYFFQLDAGGLENAAGVSALVFQLSEDEEDFIELGETVDLEGDWDTGFFQDMFDGWWLSLPDGQNLALYIAYDTENYLVYSSPVLLNGEETNLRIRQNWEDASVTVDGTWAGVDEYGVAAREYRKLQQGDVLVPVYYSYATEDFEEGYYTGQEFTVKNTLEVEYEWMDSGDYLYSFCIDDLYGDYYLSDPVMFYVDEDGEVLFYEDW